MKRRSSPYRGKSARGPQKHFPGILSPSSKKMVASVLFWSVCALASPVLAAPAHITVTADEGSAPAEAAAEIREAVLARLSGAAVKEVQVHLRQRSADIRVDGKLGSVAVADWSSGAAPRVVVMHVVDLAMPDPDLSEGASGRDETPPAAVASASVAAPAIVLAAGPELARGLETADAPALGLIVAATHLRGRLRLGVVGRWSHGLERGTDTPQQASFDAWIGGPTVGWGLGRWEAEIGPFVGRERLVTGVGANVARLTWGGGIFVRWSARPAHGFGWFAGAGLDAYARSQAFAIAGATAYATPSVAPRLAVGVTFGLPR
jgi:hypothetical protein